MTNSPKPATRPPLMALLKPGVRFSTPFESGCIVVGEPDQFGAFVALDSDGVACEYSVPMVTEVTA